MSLSRHAQLKRKTPLKRTGQLRKVSAGKRAWNTLYRAALKRAIAAQIEQAGCTFCVHCGVVGPVDPHHPEGRNGKRILNFVLVARACHDGFHFQSPRKARAEGWLAPRGNFTAGGEA